MHFVRKRAGMSIHEPEPDLGLGSLPHASDSLEQRTAEAAIIAGVSRAETVVVLSSGP